MSRGENSIGFCSPGCNSCPHNTRLDRLDSWLLVYCRCIPDMSVRICAQHRFLIRPYQLPFSNKHHFNARQVEILIKNGSIFYQTVCIANLSANRWIFRVEILGKSTTRCCLIFVASIRSVIVVCALVAHKRLMTIHIGRVISAEVAISVLSIAHSYKR